MKLHVMPGDSLTERFKQTGIEGDIAVCRECLIVGDVKAETLNEFWTVRASFLDKAYGETELSYFDDVASELKKLQNLVSGDEVNLWFEHELFCQANMWFCLSLLAETKANVFRIEPLADEVWKGFGNLNADDLTTGFTARKQLSRGDIELGGKLRTAYQNSDHSELVRLSKTGSDRFLYLDEVCRAETEKATRPLQILAEIKQTGVSEFAEIFAKFNERAPIYGFGDSQVKRMLQEI